MFPAVSDAQKVKILPVKFKDLKIYDIVLVRKNNQLLLHRLLMKDKKRGLTWGEGNKYLDGWFRKEEFLGKVENYQWQKLALVYTFEWEKIAKNLKREKVNYVILKGPLWQKKYFGYFFSKPFSDWDILIRRPNYSLSKKILKKSEWRIKIQKGINKKRVKGNNPTDGEISFTKKINSFSLNLDLHFEPFGWSEGKFFCWPFSKDDVKKISEYFLDNNKNHFLSPTDWIFYSCLHGFINHNLRDIRLLAEIANVILIKKINWEKLNLLGQKYHCTPIIDLVIYWTERMFSLRKITVSDPAAAKNKILKLFINEKTFFQPLNPISERQKNIRLNTILRFLLWPAPFWKKVFVLLKFFFSAQFWQRFFVYLSVLPTLPTLVWKTRQWLRGHLFSPPDKQRQNFSSKEK